MSNVKSEETPSPGQPWKHHKKCESFKVADSERKKLLKKDKKVEVRVRRRADDSFDIKVRGIKK